MMIALHLTGPNADVWMYADFITWSPQTCLIFRVQRDEDFISGAINVMQTFCHNTYYTNFWS